MTFTSYCRLAFLFLTSFVIGILPSSGQSLVNYSSVRNTGVTYASIASTGNSFASWRNTTSNTQDDNRSVFTAIGFDFWYLGVRYTQFSASTNGFIDFSSSTDDGGPQADDFGYSNAAFTTANINNSTRPAIAPFYDDLTTQGGVDPIGTSIKYLVSGSAPNRTLTIEWINMAVFGNVSPSLNFQVQLLETSGIIKVNYGTMNAGNHTFSFSMGLNGVTISNTPTAAQLKMLQAVNGNSFSNTVQNNLSAMPAANSQYVFTPVSPTPVSGNLTFSGVSQTGMTLNWSNWASNELGYVIYNSTDGVNYSFVTQTAVNAVSSAITGLNPSTTYFWRVYAVTEGALSAALSGTQATLGAGNKISLNSGNWNTANTWTPNGVPTAGDNVTIDNGHLVSINTNAVCNALTVGAGSASTLQFSGAARTMTVNSNLTVNSNAVFDVNAASNVTHQLTLEGNLTNNGRISFSVDANSLCNLTTSSFTTQTVSGNGTNLFNLITQNTGSSRAHMLEFSCRTFSAATNFLSLNAGTFKLSTTDPVNIIPFSGASSITNLCGLWINSPNASVSTGAGISLSGGITVSGGTLNVGNAADEDLFSNGGEVSLSAGAIQVAGKYYSSGINNIASFSISGGTLTVPVFGSSSITDAPFQVTGVGSEFDMTGGLIVIPREGGNGAQDLGFINTGASSGIVNGGTLQIGNSSTPAGQTISINSSSAIGNLIVNSANATAVLSTNSLQVINDINLVAGVLNDNNLSLALGGNWSNTGGSYANSNGTVLFNSASSNQSIFRSGAETFNNLSFTGAGIKLLNTPVSAKGFSIQNGSTVDLSSSSHSLSLSGHFINNGSFLSQNGNVLLNGTASQSVGGSSITDFYDLALNNTAGASLSGACRIINALSISNGTLQTNGQSLTLVSTASNTARINSISGNGNISGNLTLQRFIPGGSTGWAFLGAPMSSPLTFQDWDDDIFISCPTCPDGSAGGFLSIYSYNEAVPGPVDAAAAYVPLSGISDPINFGSGYWVYVGNSQFSTSDILLDVTGSVRTLNQSIPLSYNPSGSPADDGWNLIHNPYPSPVSWNAMRGSTPNLDNAIYVYNADLNSGLGGYASYVNGVSVPAPGSGGIGDEIPMCQGFYVHSTGATAIPVTESIKVNSNPVFLKSHAAQTPSNGPAAVLQLNLLDTVLRDACALYLENNASPGFDESFDAYKLLGTDPLAPMIALEKDSLLFSINGIPQVNGSYSCNLKVTTGTSGQYSITAGGLSGFSQAFCFRLYDRYTNSSHDLRSGPCQVWLYDSTSISRFVLILELNSLSASTLVLPPTCLEVNGGLIRATGNAQGPWNYTWKDGNGQVLQVHNNLNHADTLKSVGGGHYDLEISSPASCSAYSTQFDLPFIQVPQAGFTCADSLNLAESGSLSFTNTSTNSIQYNWQFGDGQGSVLPSPVHSYSLPGFYQVVLFCMSQDQCSDSVSKHILVYEAPLALEESATEQNISVMSLGGKRFKLLLPQEYRSQTFRLDLMDSGGRLVYESVQKGAEALELNLHAHASGVYFIRLQTNQNQKSIKILLD